MIPKCIYVMIYNSLFQIINTYTEAVQTVDPQLATGKLHTLWVSFAKFYEDAKQIEDVRFLSSNISLNYKIAFIRKLCSMLLV